MAHHEGGVRTRKMMLSVEDVDHLSRNSLNWEDFFGSSVELAPSLLNLYDHRIATNAEEDEEDDHVDDHISYNQRVTKTQSLPSNAEDDTVTLRYGRLPSQCLPLDRPVSLMEADPAQPRRSEAAADTKKRPLSISSMSSASTSSLPRMRKRRANSSKGAEGETSRDDSQTSDCTLVPERGSGNGSSESRHSVDSGCIDSDRNGDRFLDNMSITSSDTGSFRDEVDSSSFRDFSAMSSSPSEKPHEVHMSQTSVRPNYASGGFPSPESKSSRNSRTVSSSVPIPHTSTPQRQSLKTSRDTGNDSGMHGDKSSTCYTPPSPTIKLPSSERHRKDCDLSPDSYRRSSSSSLRYEARKKFFDHYEEHINSSPTSPLSPQDFESLSPSHSSKRNGIYVDKHFVPTSSTVIDDRASVSPPSSPHYPSSSIDTAATTAGRHREGSSQFSPNSEKVSRKSERRGSSSRHDGQPFSPSSQRSMFSRTSKKRDAMTSGDPGNRGSPVYVSYVQRVVTEIIDSERVYIGSLKEIIEGYLEPLEKILNTEAAEKDLKCLFSNIREIYKFGCTFLADLEKCAEPVKVAECFVRHNKGFVIYADYCTNYPRAVEVLTQFMQDPQLSELCRERQYALGHGLPLGAFLLKPVQRILKYHLLLQNIVKNSEKDGEEAKILEQAFHHMTEMAHHINEMKRKHEHAVRIQEIQSLLEDYVGEDLTRLGELVLESTFRVYGAKASRQVFLFERGLLISKKKEGGMHSFKTFIRCSNLMLVEVIPNEPLSFHVIPFNSPRDQYTLQARNMEQKKRWCQEMKRLIVESFKGKIPDSVKNLIMQLGTEHDDDYVPKEALDAVRKNQHTAPEYLEKRRVRRKSGSRMPDFSLLKPQRAKRGANKKNENRLGEKNSPEMGRRAASKSPEFHRRLFSRQNAMAKRRSQSTSNSLPTTPVTDLPQTEMFGQAYTNSRSATSPPVTPEAKQTSTPSSSQSKDSKSPTPVLRKSPRRKFSESSNAQEGSENDSEGLKRPVSFLMARARPINSDDLGELVVRCGGSIKMQKGQDTMLEESKACTLPTNLQDISGCSLSSLRSRSDMDDSSDDEDDDEETLADEDRSNTTEDMITETIDNTEPHVPVVSDDAQMSTEHVRSHVENNMNKRTKELTRRGSRSSSLPVLNKPVAGEKDTTNATEAKKKKKSQSSENMLDSDKVPKPRGRMSRRDMQNATYANGHHSRKETDSKENVSDHGKDDRKVTAFHDSYGKRGDKVVLRKKGLRLPNTSKHLSEQNFQSSPQTGAAKAKLTNWNSVDKLTKGSMNDVSHLEENPWVKNPDSAEKNSNGEEESGKDESFKTRHSPTPMRPRGHSDVTDMMQVSSEKEKLDWMVYLNRNSLMPPGANAKPPLSGNRVSSPLLDRRTGGKGYLDLKLSTSSQHPFATPPRAYMTAENMKKYGSSKDSTAQGPWPGYHELSGRAASSNTLPTSSNTFGVPPMNITVTKPVSFDKHNLPRWNSTPISGEGGAATKAASKGRPASMDFEKLADESNRMVAEMEEYINKVSSDESIKSPSKFPTSLPTITVEEEEADSNRLSIVSSLSTSSYESQGSSSSDGLVGTLKHKLHAWSHRPDGRHDSEQSHTSTLTSDDEDKEEESVHSFSGNTYEPPSIDRNTWKEERELETVLREHGLGSSSLGSRMAHSVLVEPVPTHSSDNSNPNARPHSSCGLSAPDKHTDAAGQVPSMIDNQPDQSRFSLPASTEATEALMPAAIKNLEIQQSDSGFSLQSNDSCLSDQAQMVTETETVPNVEHKPSTKPEPESSTKVELVSNDPSTKSEPESSKASEPVLQDSSTKPELESSKAAEPVLHDSSVKPELKSSKAAEPVSQDSSVKPELESSEAAEVVLRHSPRRSGQASSKEQTTNTTDVSQKLKTADPPSGAASHKRHTSSESIASVDSFYERKLSIAFDSEVFDDKAAVVSVYEDPPPKEQSEAPAPRKSIREYVHDLEKKLRAPSPKVFEVRRREPGAIIRQRMENLQESILNSRRSSSRSSSRPVSEERDMTRSRSSPPAHHRWTYAGNKGSTSNENVKFPVMKFSNSRDSLSKSVENLPLSRENMFLSRSRESLHSNSDYPTKPMLSTYTEKSHNAGQEKEASRFQLMSSGNQFIHRTRRNSDHARPECERAATPDQESVVAIQGSRSMCRLDELNSEVDNLVIMKGWVKALISKFQEKT